MVSSISRSATQSSAKLTPEPSVVQREYNGLVVVAAVTMLLEHKVAAGLKSIASLTRFVQTQHLIYMGWHRREPGQPLNDVSAAWLHARSWSQCEKNLHTHKHSYAGRLVSVAPSGVP